MREGAGDGGGAAGDTQLFVDVFQVGAHGSLGDAQAARDLAVGVPGRQQPQQVALPGLRFPVPGGPDAAQLAATLRMLLATGQVAALGLSCSWYPGHAAARHVAAELAAALE